MKKVREKGGRKKREEKGRGALVSAIHSRGRGGEEKIGEKGGGPKHSCTVRGGRI